MYYITQDKTGLITGRYTTEIHGDNIPQDAVEVEKELFDASIQMQRPALVNGELVELPLPEPTQEQLAQQAKAKAQTYLDKTDHKFYGDYEPKEGEDLEAIRLKRSEARTLLRGETPTEVVDASVPN